MSETKFTPGPWALRDRDVMVDRGHWQIVENVQAGSPALGGSAEANGLLIAAAPELYEALDALLGATEVLPGYEHEIFTAELDAARAALAKARGDG